VYITLEMPSYLLLLLLLLLPLLLLLLTKLTVTRGQNCTIKNYSKILSIQNYSRRKVSSHSYLTTQDIMTISLMSLTLKYEYNSQELYKIGLNPINDFKELWLLTTYGLKILQALVTRRIVHIGTSQSFLDGPNNTFIKSRNMWLQNLPACVAVI
jgi:hypothetical protein